MKAIKTNFCPFLNIFQYVLSMTVPTATVIGLLIALKMHDHRGRRVTVSLGVLIAFAAGVWIIVYQTHHIAFLILIHLIAIGMGFIRQVIPILPTQMASSAQRERVSLCFDVGHSLGGAIGLVCTSTLTYFSSLVDHWTVPIWGFVILLGFLGLVCIPLFFIRLRRERGYTRPFRMLRGRYSYAFKLRLGFLISSQALLHLGPFLSYGPLILQSVDLSIMPTNIGGVISSGLGILAILFVVPFVARACGVVWPAMASTFVLMICQLSIFIILRKSSGLSVKVHHLKSRLGKMATGFVMMTYLSGFIVKGLIGTLTPPLPRRLETTGEGVLLIVELMLGAMLSTLFSFMGCWFEEYIFLIS
ncbi:unnamed protein product, partial [Cuscuta europaea]